MVPPFFPITADEDESLSYLGLLSTGKVLPHQVPPDKDCEFLEWP
jgi:hypothetical protein